MQHANIGSIEWVGWLPATNASNTRDPAWISLSTEETQASVSPIRLYDPQAEVVSPDGGVAPECYHDAGVDRAGQAAPAGRPTIGSSLVGAMLSSVM